MLAQSMQFQVHREGYGSETVTELLTLIALCARTLLSNKEISPIYQRKSNEF